VINYKEKKLQIKLNKNNKCYHVKHKSFNTYNDFFKMNNNSKTTSSNWSIKTKKNYTQTVLKPYSYIIFLLGLKSQMEATCEYHVVGCWGCVGDPMNWDL